MKVFEDDNFRILPLYFDLISKEKVISFSYQGFSVDYINQIIAEIKQCREQNKILAIDMQFMSLLGNKTNGGIGLFEPIRELLNEYCFIFYNIQEYPQILDLILSDLKLDEESINYYNMITFDRISSKDSNINWGAYIFSNEMVRQKIQDYNIIYKLRDIYTSEVSALLKEVCIDNKIQYLPSSDIYSDTYIRIKDLFMYPSTISLSIFLLCKMIKDVFSKIRFDSIVSMSNTGAVIASLVGKMLDKDVLFCTNIGPKFALDIDEIGKKIKKGYNYLYVYDFVCLGTEIKNLKSILTCFGANVVGGVGVASLPDFDLLRLHDAESQEGKSILTNSYSLITLNKHGISYNIATNEKELEEKLIEINR